jgi:hypothetical protein
MSAKHGSTFAALSLVMTPEKLLLRLKTNKQTDPVILQVKQILTVNAKLKFSI